MPATARHQDANGFLLVRQCPIASFGIFQYSAAQLGLPGDPNRIVNVFRPESEVSNQDYLDSFQVVPSINDHEMLSGFEGDESASAPEDKGVDGVLFNVGYKSPWVLGDIKIFSRSMQADLAAGKKDLSLGYTCDFEMKPGVYNGQQYEVVQINMRGNHIALVDVGRVPGARVLDGRKVMFDHLDIKVVQPTNGANDMPVARRKALDSNVVAQLKAQLQALLPTFEQFLTQEEAEPAHQGGAEAGAEGAMAAGGAEAGGAANAAAATPEAQGEMGGGEAAAAAEPGATTEGENDGGAAAGAGGEADIGALIQQAMSIFQQLQAAIGGGAEAGAAAAGGEGGEAAGAAGEGAAEGGEGATAEGQQEGANGDGEGGEGATAEGAAGAEGTTEDTLEGLEGTTREGTDGEGASLGEGGQGSASQGPAAGKHTGRDAALRAFHADLAAKNRFVDRLSKVVGAFDGAMDLASATSADVVAYGVKKLKLKVAAGTEAIALDAYLTGIEASRTVVQQRRVAQAADAAAAAEVPAIDAYFNTQE